MSQGVVLLIVHSHLKVISSTNMDYSLYYQSFQVNWFFEGGFLISCLMLFQIFAPHIYSLCQYQNYIFKRFKDRKVEVDIEVVEVLEILHKNMELYIGPEFPMDIRLAQVCSTISITLMYSSGLPILFLFAFFSLMLTYWIDKYMLIWFYKQQKESK